MKGVEVGVGGCGGGGSSQRRKKNVSLSNLQIS